MFCSCVGFLFVGSYDWRCLCRWGLKKCFYVFLFFVVDIFHVVHEMIAAAESGNGGVSVCLSVDVVQLVSGLKRLSCASKHPFRSLFHW